MATTKDQSGWLYPDLFTKKELIDILNKRYINHTDLNSLSKDELVELYNKYVLPLPQRKHRLNRRGREMTKKQVLRAKKRRSTIITAPGQDDGQPSEKRKMIGQDLNSISSSPSASGDRLKPPPSCINLNKKTVKLTSSSKTSSTDSPISKSLDRLKINQFVPNSEKAAKSNSIATSNSSESGKIQFKVPIGIPIYSAVGKMKSQDGDSELKKTENDVGTNDTPEPMDTSESKGPREPAMSNGSSRLPSNVEEDRPIFSTSRTAMINNYTSAHPIAIGSSTFSRSTPTTPQRPLQQQQQQQPHPSFDIAPKPPQYNLYRSEAKRLETFSNWPSNAPVRKEDLARNGFIYLNFGDRTQCVFCRGILSDWEVDDVVENEHKRNCPECPLAFGYECGNIPLVPTALSVNATPQQQLPGQRQTYNTTVNIPSSSPATNTYQHTYHIVRNVTSNDDEVGHSNNDITMENRSDASGSLPQIPSVPSLPQLPSMSSQQNLASLGNRPEPKYSQWSDYNVRLQSFMGWPSQMSQKPRDLAEAGLLYMATGDKCKCFWCGGELYDWEPLDTPWEEHAKWFPQCNYVRQVKGDAYIQYVKDKQNGLIVDPSELMSKPHVLAVLQTGYTREQVQEAVSRYGIARLQSASDIIKAIDETNRERQTMLKQMNMQNSLTQTQQNPTLNDDEDLSMEIEDVEFYLPEQRTTEDNTSVQPEQANKTPTAECNSPKPSTSKSKTDKDVDSVLLENEKLKDLKLCKICMDRELNTTFLPCGHFVTCQECSKSLEECPVCRKKIEQKVKVFWG